MKNKNKLRVLGPALLLLAGLGCSGKVPPIAAILPPSLPPLPANYIDDFEDGDLNINPRLTNSLNGFWANTTYNQTTQTFLVTAPVPSNGSVNAIHLFGTYIDPGNSSYPAFQLQAYLRNDGNFYDASSFTGIMFDWNCPTYSTAGGVTTGDNSNQRFFCLAVDRTTPPSQGGGCSGTPIPCYDHFSFSLPDTAGLWTSQNITFLGYPSVPNSMYSQNGSYTMLPSDLQQIIFLLWTNRSNNVAGNYRAEFWVDNVRFF